MHNLLFGNTFITFIMSNNNTSGGYDKNTFFAVVTHVQEQMFNMNNDLTKLLFEDQEVDRYLYRKIRKLLKNDPVLYGKLAAKVTQNQDGKPSLN